MHQILTDVRKKMGAPYLEPLQSVAVAQPRTSFGRWCGRVVQRIQGKPKKVAKPPILPKVAGVTPFRHNPVLVNPFQRNSTIGKAYAMALTGTTIPALRAAFGNHQLAYILRRLGRRQANGQKWLFKRVGSHLSVTAV